jgi:hypothetical protein
MKHALMACALAATPWIAAAHEGHGETGSHWHATDIWGFVALAAIATAALWFRKK